MFNILKEIVNYTKAVELETVKIVGSDTQTQLQAVSADRSIVLESVFHQPIANFSGTLGLPNLSRLNVLLDIPEYREDSQITLSYNDNNQPDAVNFDNKNNDFHNTYRLMDAANINSKIPSVKFKEPQWQVVFTPTTANIQRLRYQSQAMSDQVHCQTYTNKNNLMMEVGDPSSFQGKFVFHPNVTGQLQKKMSWVTKNIINILSLVGDKTLSISDSGVMKITVDSGVASYNYILLTQTK